MPTNNIVWIKKPHENIMKKARPRIVTIVKPSFGLLQDSIRYTIFRIYFQSHSHVKKCNK